MSLTHRPYSMPPSSSREIGFSSGTMTGRRKSSRGILNHSSPQNSPHDARSDTFFRRACSIEYLMQHSDFASRHEVYKGLDGMLGNVLCLISLNHTQFHAIIFSSAGALVLFEQETMTQYGSILAPHLRSLELAKAIATTIHVYLQTIPPDVLCQLESSTMLTYDIKEQHVAQVISSLKPVKDISVSASLINFLHTKFTKTVNVDFIVEPTSVLQQLLPRALEAQDKHAELHKVPNPPEEENQVKCQNLIHELLATERTYVGRLQHLIKDYVLPLRAAARKQKGILAAYETNTLFPTSLDAILLLNEDLLKSLEATADHVSFALTLAKGFQDFRKIYSRYLETSSDLDHVLRAALKTQRFREFVENARSTANANIGIRELVMEPISRIPRYSLLISSLLAAMSPDNPAYRIFKEALLTVRLIGFMERDEIEASRETLMKLAALVSSWPADLIRSSVKIITYVDCLDILPIALPGPSGGEIPNQGHLCSIILCSDRLIFLKRAKSCRLEEVLSLGKRGELGYRGYVLLEDVILTSEDDCINLLLLKEVSGISSAKWVDRPYRRLLLTNTDITKFIRSYENCRADMKTSSSARYTESFQDLQIRYHVYTLEAWSREQENRKSKLRLWQDRGDTSHTSHNLLVSVNEPLSFSCMSRSKNHTEMVCQEISSLKIFKEALLEKVSQIHKTSWLDTSFIAVGTFMAINRAFADSLINATSAVARARPVSPSKIVSQFLSRKTFDPSPKRPKTSTTMADANNIKTDNSFGAHVLLKKKSNTLFNFGNDNRCLEGVDTFIEVLLSFEHFKDTDLTPTNAQETKQASNLASSIAKDPKKGFAISGSPPKIALHAFKLWCRTALPKKLAGMTILTETVCADLRAHLKYEHDIKLARMRSVLKSVPRINLGILKSILTFAAHLMAVAPADAKIAALLLISEMIVPPLYTTSFISTLEVLIENFGAFFILRDQEVATMDSRTSCMTLPNLRSQFGSVSSMSQICDSYATDVASYPSSSPAKQSYYSVTPDLVFDASSPYGSSTLFKSPSGSSVSINLDADSTRRYKRATIHVEKVLQHSSDIGLRAASAELPHKFAFEEGEFCPPRAEFGLPRSQSDQVTYTLSNSTKPVLELITSPSPLMPPDTSDLMDDLDQDIPHDHNDRAHEMPNLRQTEDLRTSLIGRRLATPSKIPVASPKLGSSPQTTPTASRTTSISGPLPVLASRKEQSIPRKPSVIANRREIRQMSKTSNFDAQFAADYYSIMQFEHTLADDSEGELDVEDSTTSASKKPDRALLRREITAGTGISSTATVRRVSRQLQRTSIGPLGLAPKHEAPLTKWQSTSPKSQAARSCETGCTNECHEAMELLRLELDHYKAIYRASVEEVDVTLDLANEQLEELQQALEVGSLEASAMKMLELEKEQNRKLRMELAILAERRQ